MEFLRPILAKIELICQQPQVSGAQPVLRCRIGCLGADEVVWLCNIVIYTHYSREVRITKTNVPYPFSFLSSQLALWTGSSGSRTAQQNDLHL